jgi:sortase B
LEEERNYRIFAVDILAVNTGKTNEFLYYNIADFKTEKDFDSYMKNVRRHSTHVSKFSVEYGDEIIALSTCEYTHKDGRLVVYGVRVANKEARKALPESEYESGKLTF